MDTYQLRANICLTVKATKEDAERISADPERYLRLALQNGARYAQEGASLTQRLEPKE